MPDILITTQRGTSNNPSMQFTGSALANIKMEVLPSGSIAFIGTSGSLFSITDNLIGSLMSVGDVSGLPILEVFSDDRIVMGKYNKNTLYVSGTNVGIGKVPLNAVLDVSGSVAITGSMTVTGSALITGSLGVTGTITGNITGTAASETLSTVTSRGATTAYQISVSTVLGGSMFTATKVGGSYGDGVSGATFKSILDNANGGGAFAFASYYGGSGGTLGASIRADGYSYFSNNVGIGTSSPTGKLQIHNASGNTISAYKDAGGAAIALGSTTGPTDYALIESINGGGVRFYTGNGTQTEKVRIDVNGNIGIGKTTPNAVLDVNGNTTITGSLTMSGTGAYPIYANGSYGVLMMYSGTNYGTIAGTNGGMVVNSTQATDLNLGTAGSANVTIKYGGNVGIGKSTPNALLDVNGNTIITGSATITTSLGVGTAASGTAGEIRATNNVTAYYSDDRLKNNLGNIPDSLNKVLSLNGFYFEANETAQNLGYTKQKEVGVSAQQVQAILPEIIAPAPIDSKYMTVRYEKLIPLLIEAIKEQNSMIVDLQQRINRL